MILKPQVRSYKMCFDSFTPALHVQVILFFPGILLLVLLINNWDVSEPVLSVIFKSANLLASLNYVQANGVASCSWTVMGCMKLCPGGPTYVMNMLCCYFLGCFFGKLCLSYLKMAMYPSCYVCDERCLHPRWTRSSSIKAMYAPTHSSHRISQLVLV